MIFAEGFVAGIAVMVAGYFIWYWLIRGGV